LDYVDTSVFVAAFVDEGHTRRAEHALTGREDSQLAISDWTITELSSALSLKLRTRSIDARTRGAALDAFAIMIAESLVLLPVERGHFRAAATFSDRHSLNLRSPDALHLAVAVEHGAVLVTLDKRLAAAAKALGVAARLI
jgi:predicted nucleic acid-binding protein